MCSNMNHQIMTLMESLVTLGAAVLLFPQVSFNMALRAGAGLRACMVSNVICVTFKCYIFFEELF